MIVLRPHNLRWIEGITDTTSDLCAHGEVEFRIGGDTLVWPAVRGITVRAAGVYLLRTLSMPHTVATPVGDHLFPCRGFTLLDQPGSDDVLILGCPLGRDVEVERRDAGHIVVRDADRSWDVDFAHWQSAVFGFADSVASLYRTSTTKQPLDDDVPGYAAFLGEWERRRGHSLCGRPPQ